MKRGVGRWFLRAVAQCQNTADSFVTCWWTDPAPASSPDQSAGCEPPAPPPAVPAVQQDAETGEMAATSSEEKTRDDKEPETKEEGKEDIDKKD